MDVIAPWRFWELNSREKEIEYAEKHHIPLKINKETISFEIGDLFAECYFSPFITEIVSTILPFEYDNLKFLDIL